METGGVVEIQRVRGVLQLAQPQSRGGGSGQGRQSGTGPAQTEQQCRSECHGHDNRDVRRYRAKVITNSQFASKFGLFDTMARLDRKTPAVAARRAR